LEHLDLEGGDGEVRIVETLARAEVEGVPVRG
jgi:hypothetical protein